MELKIIIFSLRCWFLCMMSLAATSSMLKTSVKFEVLLLNSVYAPALHYLESFMNLRVTKLTQNFNIKILGIGGHYH